MKRIVWGTLLLLPLFLFAGMAHGAKDEAPGIPDRVSEDHWSCRDLSELTKKYETTEKLPAAADVGGRTYTKHELARVLYAVLEEVMRRAEKEGKDALAGEDLDKLARLHEELREDLLSIEAYRTRREGIDKILARPDEPSIELKAGIKGFLRGEGAGNYRLQDLEYNPGHTEGRFLYRVLPYVSWHPTDFLDVHLEGQGYGYTGGSQYLGRISLYQGFVEGRLPGSDLLALKVGRQDFAYGSVFILGNDSWFKGLSFDAARLRIKPAEALTVDLLGGWYAPPWADGVKGNLAGGYASYKINEGTVIEAYGFNDTGSEEHHSGEHLNIFGLRATASLGPVSLEFEPVIESGRTYNGETGLNDRVSAWGGHADMTIETLILDRKNTFFLSYAYGSGGKDAANGVSARREFRMPNNDTALTGDLCIIGDLSGVDAGGHHASGLQVFNLGWGIDITDKLNFSATGRYFYANAVEEGFSRRIGLETDFTLTYTVNERLSLIFGYDRLFTGGFFRDATGSSRDIDCGYVQAQFDLSWSKPGKVAKR